MSGKTQTPPPTADDATQGLQVFEDVVALLAACLTDEDAELIAKLMAPPVPDPDPGSRWRPILTR